MSCPEPCCAQKRKRPTGGRGWEREYIAEYKCGCGKYRDTGSAVYDGVDTGEWYCDEHTAWMASVDAEIVALKAECDEKVKILRKKKMSFEKSRKKR